MKTWIFAITSLALAPLAQTGRADCIPQYEQVAREAESTASSYGAMTPGDYARSSGLDDSFYLLPGVGQFYFSTYVGHEGINSSARIAPSHHLAAANEIINLLKEAQAGTGPDLVEFYRSIEGSLNREADFKLQDIAEIINEANQKNAFCETKLLATMKQIRKMIIDLSKIQGPKGSSFLR